MAKVTTDGFNRIDGNRQEIFTSIDRLRCSLQFQLVLANAAEKRFLEYDEIVWNGPLVLQCRISDNLIDCTESNTAQTLRIVWQSFQKHGWELPGAMAPLAIDRRNSAVKPTSLCGKKFLALFWNAACVTYHQQGYATPNRFFELKKNWQYIITVNPVVDQH